MNSKISRSITRILTALALVSFVALGVAAQEIDPDPNSPTPVLLSQADSTYALFLYGKSRTRVDSPSSLRPVPIYSTIKLFVTNISLMKDEGASAFRVYVEDVNGRAYRFPVLAIEQTDAVKSDTPVYAVTVLLRDELGFWETPPPDGDALIDLAWRGLASNRVKLGINQLGGKIKDDPGAVPTPPQTGIKIGPLSTTDAVSGRAGLTSGKTAKTAPQAPNLVGYRWSGDRMRFLEQATFGPTPALDSRIRRIGIRAWLSEQFDAPYPSAANPYPVVPLKPTNAPADCDGDQTVTPDVPVTCFRDVYSMNLPQTWFYKEALYGDNQLRHRASWALDQIWVISGFNTQQSSYMVEYQKQISKNAFGNWRQLMSDLTLNPGMGNYLDMMRSTKTNPNENYPREILQLFNVGLFMLNDDGTVQCVEHNPCQAGDTPIPTYDQTTINNFTKVFTGWRDCRTVSATCPNLLAGIPDYKDPMELSTGNHDLTAKTLFSYPGSTTTNIAACANCTGGTSAQNAANITIYANNSLNQALDNIYNHPNVAPFVTKHLIQALVTSDPTPAYVQRMSAVFNANRTNPAQLKEVLKAILLDPEARGDVKTDPNYGKLREPVQLATNLLRNFNVTGATGFPLSDGVLDSTISPLGQSVYFSPTVFNFYPPDYIVPGTTLLGPEFAIYTTGTTVKRVNIGNTFIMGTGIASNPGNNIPNGTKIDLSDVIAMAAADPTGNQMMDYLNTRMMHGTMSAQMKSTILTSVLTPASNSSTLRAQTAVYLIFTSSQYQVQR